MPLKDHYRTLGLTATASVDDIKKAFRKLAHQYHPDKNQTQGSNTERFRQVQEAYNILGDAAQKKAYDEQRHWAGLIADKEPASITPTWLLQQAKQLQAQLKKADRDTLNQALLRQYLSHLLSDAHLAIIAKDADEEQVNCLFTTLLATTEKMELRYFEEIAPKLRQLSNNAAVLKALDNAADKKAKDAMQRKLLPFLIIFITLFLCALMYFYTKIG